MFPEITRDDVFRLESRRLWLRWPTQADAAAIAAVAGRSDVAEMTVQVPHPYPKGEASRQIEHWRARNGAGQGLTLVMTGHGEDRDALGLIDIEPLPPGSIGHAVPNGADGAAKIGLLLAPDRWGLGLATEAVQAVVDAAFVLSGIDRIDASVRVVNPAGRRVVERCGFAYEATVLKHAPARGGMVPCDCFRLDRKTWASLKQWRMPVGAGGLRLVPGRPDKAAAADPCCA